MRAPHCPNSYGRGRLGASPPKQKVQIVPRIGKPSQALEVAASASGVCLSGPYIKRTDRFGVSVGSSRVIRPRVYPLKGR